MDSLGRTRGVALKCNEMADFEKDLFQEINIYQTTKPEQVI